MALFCSFARICEDGFAHCHTLCLAVLQADSYRTKSQSCFGTLHPTLACRILSSAETCGDCGCAGLMSRTRLRGRTPPGICLPTPCPPALEAPFSGGTFPRRLSGRKKMHKVSSLVTHVSCLYAQQPSYWPLPPVILCILVKVSITT